jgi:cysteinyl-tRNA synthetase
MRRGVLLGAVLAVVLAVTASELTTHPLAPPPPPSASTTAPLGVASWVDQLQNYADGRLDAIAAAPYQLAVIDLARDGGSGYFRPEEVAAVRTSGKIVLSYFEIGSIEDYRPEAGPISRDAPDLVLNRWESWPHEHFVRYWDPRWWDRVIQPRLDQALSAGFDGVYLDTPLAYEELDLAMVPGLTRPELARAMADLVIRMSRYAKSRHPGFLIVPLNSPELREQSGYVDAIDGIGVESLFYLPTDRPCDMDYCPVNLGNVRALRAAGKFVLAVDYAAAPDRVQAACGEYRREGFAGYVGPLELNRIAPPCPRAE